MNPGVSLMITAWSLSYCLLLVPLMMISRRTEATATSTQPVTAATTTVCLAVPRGAPWAAASIRPSSTRTAARGGWDFSNAEISEDHKNTDVDRSRRAAKLMNPCLSLQLPGYQPTSVLLSVVTMRCMFICCLMSDCWSSKAMVAWCYRHGHWSWSLGPEVR